MKTNYVFINEISYNYSLNVDYAGVEHAISKLAVCLPKDSMMTEDAVREMVSELLSWAKYDMSEREDPEAVAQNLYIRCETAGVETKICLFDDIQGVDVATVTYTAAA